MNVNPITRLDYPDPDVIRVEDTYYMVSTTMHFMPGCEILQSFDLVHWEHATYVYETLDHTDAQQLKSGQNIYGQGMWAASLRYHEGRFYICFVANDTRKTYLYTSEKIDGPWKKQLIEGFYHDGSLLFDEDGRNYIVYGNDEIWITELNEDLTAPKKDGLHRLLVSDHKNPKLGYEGSLIQKINGYYYIFLIHSLRDRWMRTEACFYSDSLEGEFTGGDVLCDDRGYCGQGVAQGGIVDTPDGKWYAMLFQDSGAVGRIPILLPVTWKDHFPVFGQNGHVPEEIEVHSTRQGYIYQPFVGSDDFCNGLLPRWQFNHNPDPQYYHLDATFDNTLGKYEDGLTSIRYDYFNLDDKNIFRAHEPLIAPAPPCPDGNHFYYREKKLSFTKLEDVYKRALQAAKKGREFTFHWRGGYLTREVLADLVDQIQAAGKTRDKKAIITLNWPQAVLRFHFVEQQAEGKVFIEEVNEGEKL